MTTPEIPERDRLRTVEAIIAAALEVFTSDELNQLVPQVRASVLGMIGRRLAEPGPPPTRDELEGIRELATEHLWPAALNGLAARR